MDPAVLNYLQNQQTQSASSGLNEPKEAAPYNPFDLGIRRAIDSARESLGMTEKQQDKALRRSLLAFGNNMSQQPVQKGFFNNFGAVARSLNPALSAYDESEEQSLTQNNNLANQILAYRAANEAKQAKAEEQQWRRQYAEKQLTEQQRYHDMLYGSRNRVDSSTLSPNVSQEGASLGNEFLPLQTKNEIAAYAKDKRALGSVLKEVDDLEKSYNKFRKDYKGNIIDPMSPVARVANPAKDLLGRFGYSDDLRKETADRKTLGSKLNKFVVTSERALKGGGVMGPTLIKMFKEQGIYPDLEHDTPEIFESKLKMLKEEIENSYKAANLSLNHGRRIDPSQVEEFQNSLNQMNQANKQAIIPSVDKEEAFQKFLKQIKLSRIQNVELQDMNGDVVGIPVEDENALKQAFEDGFSQVANE